MGKFKRLNRKHSKLHCEQGDFAIGVKNFSP
jgi:hypothetical protein